MVPFVYAGVAIISPSVFKNAPKGEFSLTKVFDTSNEAGRLFGLRLDGLWMHVGTPDAVPAAENALLESAVAEMLTVVGAISGYWAIDRL